MRLWSICRKYIVSFRRFIGYSVVEYWVIIEEVYIWSEVRFLVMIKYLGS